MLLNSLSMITDITEMTVAIIQCFHQELHCANFLRNLLQDAIFHKGLNNQFSEIDDNCADLHSVYYSVKFPSSRFQLVYCSMI